ncbi:hypothetical protein [Collinsella aerofaciens]|uniref:hypothetical protein n=1 Tax=Collinsella aerofaciens TaxID=74426 RepID=UPI003D7A6D8E
MGKMNQDEFLGRLRNRNSHYAAGEFEVLGEYAGIGAPLRCRCLVCGNVWDGNPDSMLRRNSRCPKCGRPAAGKSSGKSRTLTHEEFVGRATDVCPDIEVVGRYAGANTRLVVRCRTCGYSWEAFPATILRSCSCPCCTNRVAVEGGQRPRDHASRYRGGVGLRAQWGAEAYRRRGGLLQKGLVAMP